MSIIQKQKIMFKKVIYLGLMAGAVHFADAQKINLGKALDAGVKGVKALTFSNADAARLSRICRLDG